MDKRNNKDALKALKKIFAYVVRDYKLELVIVVIAVILSSVALAAGSRFLQILIDNYITPMLKTGSKDFTPLFHAILIMGVIYLVGVLSSYLYNYLMVNVSEGTMKKIRDEMFRKMQQLSIGYFDTHSHGDIMSHFTNDSDTLRQMLSQSVPSVLTSSIQLITVFIVMITLNVPLTFIAVLSIFLISLVGKRIASSAGKFFMAQQTSLGKVNGFIEETMNGQKVVKVFNKENDMIKEFDHMNHELVQNATQANKYANIMMPVMINLTNLEYTIVGVMGGILALTGHSVTVGIVASFLQLSRNFSMPISNISQQANSIIMALAGADRIFKLMEQKPEVDQGKVTLIKADFTDGNCHESEEFTGCWAWKEPHVDGTFTYREVRGDVRFENVDFGYTKDHLVLKDITLYAEEGQKVAFVGSTGAGKTTITNLINRFYDITSGKITYDGINIKDIKKDDLRRSLGIILQDVNLFTGTIMENIRYGNLHASDEDCIQAAKLANAHTFIKELPDGYQTVIKGNGSSLSQGQMQLLSIARAAVANPPVMIMDEATSSIDTRTENLVQEGMDLLMQGRTVFVIAHRLSTVRNADVIMVLDHGQIIERGDHESLMAKKGIYYELNTGKLELD